MAKLDDANTTGFYSELIACTAGNGFEDGKTYTIYIEATVDSDKGGICYGLKCKAQDATDVYSRVGAPAGASIAADLVVIDNFVDDLETRLTAARAGYLDALNGHIAQTGDNYPVVTHATYGLAVIEALVDDLEGRLSAIRAGYLDNLNGHVAQTGDNFARLGAPAGASIAADIAAISAGDASEAKQDTIITHLTDVKGTGFVKDTNSLVNIVSGTPVYLEIGGQEVSIE